jgi:LAO/AO transport system kinase
VSRLPPLEDLVAGVRAADRAMLGRAITLVESNRPEHAALAQALLTEVLAFTGNAHRVGVTGVPGVGKSTFIEALGTDLTEAGRRVAVLAVDPTSTRTGGSILGDKTRMAHLANDPNAFVRPSPTSGELGGVNRMTRETMLLCEAAGYDVVLVETVGVGQSETVVADMVDFFLVLMLPGAGDELQGIKKGILELADMIAVNKADGDNATRAARAAAEYQMALHLMAPASPNWTPPVLTCSGLTGEGLDTLWEQVELHRRLLTDSGELADRREDQRVRWMWSMLEDHLSTALRRHPAVAELLPVLEAQVRAEETTPVLAVDRLMAAFLDERSATGGD